MTVKLRLIVLVMCFICSGCGIAQNANVANGAIGGLAGTLVGGTAGALMGNAISRGDVAKSAGIGAGVGLVAGVAAGVAYTEVKQARILAANREKIEENYQTIFVISILTMIHLRDFIVGQKKLSINIERIKENFFTH